MFIFEREIGGRRYRIAAQSLWDPGQQRPFARQAVLGPADPPPVADLARTHRVGELRLGDIGAVLWVADQLDVVGLIDRACGLPRGEGPSVGEMVVAVAAQRACAPGAKRDLSQFLGACLPRASCLPASAFTGQAFHRLAGRVTHEMLDAAQIEIARAAVARFDLSANVLAFDSTNFDTFISTMTPSELARRGHAKSKRADLRVVGLAVLASETGHVPLLHRTYPGNDADQTVLSSCLQSLAKLHAALDQAEGKPNGAQRTIVRDGGFWREQLELDLDVAGYYSIISLPLGHKAAEEALQYAAQRGRMKRLRGPLSEVRVARLRTHVGTLDRTLIVAESPELLRGQKRGIAVALRKAKRELTKLQMRAAAGRVDAETLRRRLQQALSREHLAQFVSVTIGGPAEKPTLTWSVDEVARRLLERTRLGRRVLCTDHHNWTADRIVRGFRGQWNVEELFRRAKKGGVVPWGPSHQWADASLRMHTFATVLGLVLVSLAKLALRSEHSVSGMMKMLAGIRATQLRTTTGSRGRRPTVLIPPDLGAEERRAVRAFDLERWLPTLLSSMPQNARRPSARALPLADD